MVHVSMFWLTHCSCGAQGFALALLRRLSMVAPCGLAHRKPLRLTPAHAFFPPVQSKIAPLISLTLHSQRRSSMVCFRVAHRDSQTHPGLRIHFTPVRLHPILSSDILRTLNLLIRVQRNHQQLLLPLLPILRIHC